MFRTPNMGSAARSHTSILTAHTLATITQALKSHYTLTISFLKGTKVGHDVSLDAHLVTTGFSGPFSDSKASSASMPTDPGRRRCSATIFLRDVYQVCFRRCDTARLAAYCEFRGARATTARAKVVPLK